MPPVDSVPSRFGPQQRPAGGGARTACL